MKTKLSIATLILSLTACKGAEEAAAEAAPVVDESYVCSKVVEDDIHGDITLKYSFDYDGTTVSGREWSATDEDGEELDSTTTRQEDDYGDAYLKLQIGEHSECYESEDDEEECDDASTWVSYTLYPDESEYVRETEEFEEEDPVLIDQEEVCVLVE